jgi:hypothetical protein
MVSDAISATLHMAAWLKERRSVSALFRNKSLSQSSRDAMRFAS